MTRITAVLSVLALSACGGGDGAMDPPRDCWRETAGNPIIAFGRVFANAFWNDPTVLAVPGGFRMWLSAGDLYASPIRVAVYEARSEDGLTWDIDPVPRLAPTGEPRDFDGLRVETPEVVQAEGRFHLYYSGCSARCEEGVYAIGHAISFDGVTWTRDPANPVLAPQPDPGRWGAYTAVEPGVLYEPSSRRYLLYHVGARTDPATARTELAILLATSPDGSTFTPLLDRHGERVPVLRLPDGYPDTYAGVTQPDPFLGADGRIHLFYTVVATLEPFTTHAMAHAVSRDGIHFVEIEREILPRGRQDWKHASGGRAPSVLETPAGLRLWFQGNSDLTRPGFQAGIGHARRAAQCP